MRVVSASTLHTKSRWKRGVDKDQMNQIHIPEHIQKTWQTMTDLMAQMTEGAAALILRYTPPDIEVFVSSLGDGTPYPAGRTEPLHHAGLFGETVLHTHEPLFVSDASTDKRWRHGPLIKGNAASYLGFPVFITGGGVYGIFCVLGRTGTGYPEPVRNLMTHLCHLMESQLELICINRALAEENRRYSGCLTKHRALHGMVTICANCKSVKDAHGNWQPIESFHPGATFSHGICPACRRLLYPDLK